MPLTQLQRASWREHGYLAIPGFFEESEVRCVERVLEETWEARPADVTVDDLVTGERLHASSVTDEARAHTFKINDLYLRSPELRKVASSERVVELLGELLDDVPVVCNTLNLPCGSQQEDHLDTLYMTPRTEGALLATWMALEDVAPDAGPLRYYPGSQAIRPYRFSSGSLHVEYDEMDDWAHYMADAVDRSGLEEQRFLARRGDLFIWSAFLLHGGTNIETRGRTRNSLVTHFWTRSDCEAVGSVTRPVESGAGLWLVRPPQPVPGEEATPEERELSERAHAEEFVTAARDDTPPRSRSLYDRLRALASSRH